MAKWTGQYPPHDGLILGRFPILGVGGFVLALTPFIWGVPVGPGVGADAGVSSSVFTAEALLLLLF